MRTECIALCAGIIICWSTANTTAQPALKEVFKNDFMIGAALNPWQVSGTRTGELQIIKKHFNTITPENALKWSNIHPRPDHYTFAQADSFVQFGQEHSMFIVGHTLIWHSQTPRWVFQDQDGKPLGKQKLLQRMREHIHTVVGRYKGKIRGRDVVNEALNNDGTLRQSPWLRIIGENYILNAFQFAHEADPEAELYYNDYSLEDESKRMGALELAHNLQAAGVKLTGIGLQGHYNLERPTARQVDETIQAFAKLGLKVMITELDVNVLPTPGPGGADISMRFNSDPKLNPYTNGLPEEVQQRLARRYAELFKVFLKNRQSVARVTFWGVTDRSSWLNHFPVRGRTNYPLLFGRDCQPKPAFHAVVALRQNPAGPE